MERIQFQIIPQHADETTDTAHAFAGKLHLPALHAITGRPVAAGSMRTIQSDTSLHVKRNLQHIDRIMLLAGIQRNMQSAGILPPFGSLMRIHAFHRNNPVRRTESRQGERRSRHMAHDDINGIALLRIAEVGHNFLRRSVVHRIMKSLLIAFFPNRRVIQ